ncbi:MAG: hypothetical protein ACK5NG_09865 [Chthoniobacterales bacterium]
MRLTILFLFISLLSVSAARDEFVEPGPSPPIAKNIDVNIYVGEAIDIPLQALGRSSTQARFLLRSYPSAGNLAKITPSKTKPGHATVHYQHRKGGAPGTTDSFTYAVQSSDSPVSAPGKVRIHILERPPAFELPKLIDFGEVISGRTTTKTFTIANRGGGVVAGLLKVAAPWQIVGSPNYRLTAGQSKQVEIAILPEEPADLTAHVFFSHDDETLLPVTAKAVAPFSIENGKIYLSHPLSQNSENEAKSRTTLKVINNLDEALPLKLDTPDFILAENEIEIPAKKTIFIPLHAQFSAMKGGEGLITLEANDYTHTLPVTLYHAPESYTVVPGKGIDFGVFPSGENRSATLRFANTGGTLISIDIKFPDEIQIEGGSRLTLEVGEKKEKNISFASQKIGVFSDSLELVSEKSQKTIPLAAEVLPAGETKSALPLTKISPNDQSEPDTSDTEKKTTSKKPVKPTGRQVQLPQNFEKLQVLGLTQNAIRVAWKASTDTSLSHQVLAREIGQDPEGNVTQTWKPLPNVFLNKQDGLWMADITGLRPAQPLNLRISTVNSEGKPIALSHPFNIASLASAPKKPFPTNWLLAAILTIAILIWIRYLQIRNKAQHQSDIKELDKILKR